MQRVQPRQCEINRGVGVVPRPVILHVFDIGLFDCDFDFLDFTFLPGVGHFRGFLRIHYMAVNHDFIRRVFQQMSVH